MFEIDGPEQKTPHHREVYELPGEITLIDDTATNQANSWVMSLKRVTQAAAGERRVVVVTGAVDLAGDSDYDTLPGLAAVVIRLNVAQVFAIGPQARAIAVSIGLEGSWDGESQHSVDSDQGYDEVRAFIRPGDVVVIMGSTEESLHPLFLRLKEDLQ
jgi:UDP-N-acetylmuramoyl-tripeptide--D-alanyl-D-alanine ligase